MACNSGTTLGPNSMGPRELLTASGVDGPLGEHRQVRRYDIETLSRQPITPS